MAIKYIPPKGWDYVINPTITPPADSIAYGKSTQVGDRITFEKTATHNILGINSEITVDSMGKPTATEITDVYGEWEFNCKIKDYTTKLNGTIFRYSLHTGDVIPVFTGIFNLADGGVGDTYNYSVASMNIGGAAKNYTLNGILPEGLSLNTTTGIISGSAIGDGEYSGISITASNDAGSATTNTDSFTIYNVVTPTSWDFYECESFLLRDYGDLTGVTAVYIDGVICTALVLSADKLSLTATAPCTGVAYSDHAVITFDGWYGDIVNLLTKTEDFTAAKWTKENTTVIANTSIAPDGTVTADTVTESANSLMHNVKQVRLGGTMSNLNISFYVKYIDCPYVAIHTYYDSADHFVVFDISSGTVFLSTEAKMTNPTITPTAEGFYRISCTSLTGATTIRMTAIDPTGSNLQYAGTGRSFIAWGAQVTAGLDLKPYKPN